LELLHTDHVITLQVAHLLLPRQHSAPEQIEPPSGNTHPGPNPLYLTGSTRTFTA
jgi:hypothetical protein